MAQAFRPPRVGTGEALLVALDQNDACDGPDFLRFRERHPLYVHVDRVVVATAARRRRHPRRLYRTLFEAAAASHARVVYEVNLDPSNPESDAFHAALGFQEVGRAAIRDGSKTVCYLERRLAGDSL